MVIIALYLIWGMLSGGFRERLSTEITIDAPAEDVWSALIDLPRYNEWNPFIQHVEGSFTPGETVKLSLKSNPEDAGMTITPIVLAVQKPSLLKWKGSILIPYLFDATHEFVLESIEDKKTILRQAETFEGVFIPIARLGLFEDTKAQFEFMNEALKKFVETGN